MWGSIACEKNVGFRIERRIQSSTEMDAAQPRDMNEGKQGEDLGDLTEMEKILLMRALEESAAMHQTTISTVNCDREFTDDTSPEGTILHQVPIFNQFHERWNELIGKYDTASAICGYTAIAIALVLCELNPHVHTMTKVQVQAALCDLTVIDPKVEDAMRYVQTCRKRYVEQHPDEFRSTTDVKMYMKAWVANFEISDYLRFAYPSSCGQVAFVRFNQSKAIADSSHEEKTRILAEEMPLKDSNILVEMVDDYDENENAKENEKLEKDVWTPAQLYRSEDIRSGVLFSKYTNKHRAVIVDVSGHFAVVASCSDGKALFNTTDGSYISYPGRDTVAVAYSLLLPQVEYSFPFPVSHIVANLGRGRYSDVFLYRIGKGHERPDILPPLATNGFEVSGYMALKKYTYGCTGAEQRRQRHDNEVIVLNKLTMTDLPTASATASATALTTASATALTTASAGCPYITRFLLKHTDSSGLYIVMTPALGGSLHKHIQRSPHGGCLHITTARAYCAELVSALLHMRKHNCVHRDIKANNVLLNHHGHAILCDFGSSKYIPPRAAGDREIEVKVEPTIDALGNFIYIDPDVDRTYIPSGQRTFTLTGTIHAMAPEMVACRGSSWHKRDRGHSFPVDWWALGILLHEMLCGKPPHWKQRDPDSNAASVNADTGSMLPSKFIEHAQYMIDYHEEETREHTNGDEEADGELEGKHIMAGCWNWKHATYEEMPPHELACYQDEGHLGKAAYDLVNGLLQISPMKRLMCEQVTKHAFFSDMLREERWIDVHTGVAPHRSPWPDFDQRLGFMDLVDPSEIHIGIERSENSKSGGGAGGDDEDLTEAQQALFADF